MFSFQLSHSSHFFTLGVKNIAHSWLVVVTFDSIVEAGKEEGGEVGAEAGVHKVEPHPLIRHPAISGGAILGS